MNGSNHLAESESRPFALCPVDLRKLSATINDARLPSGPLDVVARERAMLEWFEMHGLEGDAAFTRRCLASLGQPAEPAPLRTSTAIAALSLDSSDDAAPAAAAAADS